MSNGIEIPALEEIDSDTFGELSLEVIAEGLYFNTWKSPFRIKSKKSVKVNEVNAFEEKNEKKPKIKVNNVVVNESKKQRRTKSASKTPLTESKNKLIAKQTKKQILEKVEQLSKKIEENKKTKRNRIKHIIDEISEQKIEQKKEEEIPILNFPSVSKINEKIKEKKVSKNKTISGEVLRFDKYLNEK